MLLLQYTPFEVSSSTIWGIIISPVEGQMRWSLKRSRTTLPALPLSLLLTTSGSGGVARQIGASAVCGGCGDHENRSEIVPIRNRTSTSADTHGWMTHMTRQSLRSHPGYGLASHSVSMLQPLLYLLYIRARTRRSNRISLSSTHKSPVNLAGLVPAGTRPIETIVSRAVEGLRLCLIVY